MAVTNRPVCPPNTMQRKDRQAYTASLSDPRQWPSLGKVDSLIEPILPVSRTAAVDVSTASSPGPSDASVSLPATRPASQMNSAAGNTAKAPLWTVKAAEYSFNSAYRNQRRATAAPAQEEYYYPRQSTPQFSKDSYYDGPSMALPNWQRKKQKFNWRRGPTGYPYSPSSRPNYSQYSDDSSYYNDDYEDDSYYDNGYNNWDNGRAQPQTWYPEENGMEGYSQDYFQLTNEFATHNDFGYYNDVPAGTVLDGEYSYDAQKTSAAPPVDPLELRQMIRHQIEYYFSPENLEKDFFLRRMMAADGSVMLSLVASFQRVSALTDNYQIILEAVVNSRVVECTSSSEGHLIRPRENAASWPLEDDSASDTVSYYIGSQWGFTPEDFARMYEQDPSQFDDEEEESGTGEDALGEEEEPSEEEVSIDGSEVSSELSEDLMKMLKMKEATLNAGLLQQVA